MDLMSIVAVTCLTMNIYMESRSESYEGQNAVAQVTVRRADYSSRRVCAAVMRRAQFSWTAGTDGNARGNWDDEAWRRAQSVARQTLLWAKLRHYPDYSAGATHYATKDTVPYWAKNMVVTARIGNHIFYQSRTRAVERQLEAIRRMQ